MLKSIKNFFINFGLEIVAGNILQQLTINRKFIQSLVEDNVIRMVNEFETEAITELATEPADKQLLLDSVQHVKDKGVLFIRMVITLTYYVVLFLLKSNLDRVIKKFRV